MSSIMWRRRGLSSEIWGSPVRGIRLRQPQCSQTGDLTRQEQLQSRQSGFVHPFVNRAGFLPFLLLGGEALDIERAILRLPVAALDRGYAFVQS
jgi:hypothetical protein